MHQTATCIPRSANPNMTANVSLLSQVELTQWWWDQKPMGYLDVRLCNYMAKLQVQVNFFSHLASYTKLLLIFVVDIRRSTFLPWGRPGSPWNTSHLWVSSWNFLEPSRVLAYQIQGNAFPNH